MVELLPPSGRNIIVFFNPTHYKIPNVGVKCTGVAQTNFDRIRRLSRKRYEIGPWLLWINNMKSQVAHRSALVPMSLSVHKRREARGLIFMVDLGKYACTV